TYWIGKVYAQLGQPEEAVRWIERAQALGYWNAPWVTRDPALQPLHARQDFAALLASMKEKHEAFSGRVRNLMLLGEDAG
ncbi:MAG TPA: hypothetical protein VFO85_21075, partial [Vicinamibacteria bacterium]|nr:hypothetical protein [Vicinamibacteria bacterium]